jgi:hypothetical protein
MCRLGAYLSGFFENKSKKSGPGADHNIIPDGTPNATIKCGDYVFPIHLSTVDYIEGENRRSRRERTIMGPNVVT